jgi:hypothetical protein
MLPLDFFHVGLNFVDVFSDLLDFLKEVVHLAVPPHVDGGHVVRPTNIIIVALRLIKKELQSMQTDSITGRNGYVARGTRNNQKEPC